jgi:hypothetical protein
MRPETPAPTASISPAPSLWGIISGALIRRRSCGSGG